MRYRNTEKAKAEGKTRTLRNNLWKLSPHPEHMATVKAGGALKGTKAITKSKVSLTPN